MYSTVVIYFEVAGYLEIVQWKKPKWTSAFITYDELYVGWQFES